MNIKSITATFVLFLFVISSGLQMGAATYEVFVITPLWSGALPHSVTSWNPIPAYEIQPANYWMKGSPLYAVCTVMMLSVAWLLPKPQRYLALLAGVMGAIVVISTMFFFVPILRQTISNNGAGLTGEEITRLATMWVNWNWARFAVGATGWLLALRVLTMPLGVETSASKTTDLSFAEVR